MSTYDIKEKILPRWKVTGKGRAVASEQINNNQKNTSNGKFQHKRLAQSFISLCKNTKNTVASCTGSTERLKHLLYSIPVNTKKKTVAQIQEHLNQFTKCDA